MTMIAGLAGQAADQESPATGPTGRARAVPLRARFTVAGLGTALPEMTVTNDDFARYLDTSDKWITSRTGIRERRIAGPGESTGQLALVAARRALQAADLRPRDVDTIIVATTTPERPMPSTAAGLAAALDIEAGAFDVNAACAGFVYGLTIGASLLETGASRRTLLVGSETISRIVDQDDRSTAVLFGDGAGALVLCSPQGDAGDERRGGLCASDLVDDPRGAELLVVPAGGSAEPVSHESLAAGRHFVQMEGNEVFRRAVRGVSSSITRTLERAGCTADDVDLFVPHQANARIIEAVLPRVGLQASQAIQTVDRHGNTSAASIPLALAEAERTGRLRENSLVLTSGFGAGLTIGTALIRWTTQATRSPNGTERGRPT